MQTYLDQPIEAGPTLEGVHGLTPETETTTHYFWVGTRDSFVGNSEASEQLRAGVEGAFKGENEPMIESIQSQMGNRDFFEMNPVMLTTDAAAVRARRVLARLIRAETEAGAWPPGCRFDVVTDRDA